MANSCVHRLLTGASEQPANCFSIKAATLIASAGPSSLPNTLPSHSAASSSSSNAAASQAAIHHHQLHQQQIGAGNKADAAGNYRGHQRRQSVARLLPDISKLRLLSWLIEASSELINCDIAIMDGVYAKLNRSQESLLFWNTTNGAGHLFAATTSQQLSPETTQANLQQQQQPPAPSVQPVANKLVISQRNKLRQKQLQQQKLQNKANHRNHHSLPLTNYDASSLAAVSLSASLGPSIRTRRATGDTDSLLTLATTSNQSQQQQGEQVTCDTSNNEDFCDSNQSDDDDNSSATSSSTSSSGIHGGGTSLSSASSSASSSCSASDLGQTTTNNTTTTSQSADQQQNEQQTPIRKQQAHVSSAEQLSEKIRRTVMEHNYLQSLLVNIIRQHDRQRDLFNRQRRRLIAVDQLNGQQQRQQQQQRYQQQRIDLTEIADALDDGCLCSCHSQRNRCQITPVVECSGTDITDVSESATKSGRSSTLPVSSCSQRQQVAPARKVRNLKKLRGNNGNSNNSTTGLNREDIIQLLADKLCENCFETHYWLHSCSIDLLQPNKTRQDTATSSNSSSPTSAQQDANGTIAKRNATFIKLVQQEVRSTISKSIELIDLIRKEIKLPESIKQKQLMRCFSTSIQLLTSVGNYVVPAQDISTFIPEVGQQQTTLFCLPSSDFDHLLLYPTSMNNNNNDIHNHNNNNNSHLNQHQQLNYHLASAPDIPIRRRANQQSLLASTGFSDSNNSGSLPIPNRGGGINQSTSYLAQNNNSSAEQLLSTNLQRLKTSDNSVAADSSSGNSSNNSSASSSIARGTVQQSSLTRAQTSSAILDGKASHDLSFEAIANLSGHHTEDDMMFQARPRFWHSSKFNFIKKLLHVKQKRLLRQQSKDRRIYNNKVQHKFRLVMMDLTHFNKSQQLLTTENGVNSLLTSMRNVLEFGLYLTLKLC